MIAAVLALILYANTLSHDYCLDDFAAIKENWIVKGGLKNIGLILTREYRAGFWNYPGSLYRPIPLIIFALQWQLSPDNPFLGHFTNWILYACTGFVLWITWRRVLYNFPPVLPALGTLFFITHPVHTEAVANIKSLDEILSFLCCTLALFMLWRYHESLKTKWLFFSVCTFTLALFSKESAVTFLPVFFVVLMLFAKLNWKKSIVTVAWFLIPVILFFIVRQQVIGAQPYTETISPWDNFMVLAGDPVKHLASACMMLVRYGQVLLIPFSLVSDLGYKQFDVVTFADWRAMLGLIALISMVCVIILRWKKKTPEVAFCIIFLSLIAISTNIFFLIGTSYAERLMYAPVLGFALLLSWLILRLFKIEKAPNVSQSRQILNPNGKGIVLWSVCGVILVAYSILTVQRNPAWKDNFTLYEVDIKTAPNSAKLNYHVGLEKMKQGMKEASAEIVVQPLVDEALAYFSKSISLFPYNPDAYSNRGQVYTAMKQYDLAYNDFRQALSFRSNDARALSNMGFIYFNRGDLDSAEYVMRQAVISNPRFVDAYQNLGAVLGTQKIR